MLIAQALASKLAPPPPAAGGAVKYRADIDGLRALAVLVVVLYHARPSIAPGGFVGVDVFFVISGYLITRLLDQDIAENRFSLFRFYERRVRRIFPALFAMLAVTTFVAALLLIPSDFRAFGRNAVGAAAFVSNIFLWLQGSYFESAEARPLLHTWSLAIEEQFYLFFPLVLAGVRKAWPGATVPLLAAIALCSLAASVVMLPMDPTAVFYLPHYRFWELLGGSLIALGMAPRWTNSLWREIASTAGLCMILVAAFGFSDTTAFPGMAALLPCVGTMLVIHAGESGSTAVSRMLAIRPMVAAGLISYSVYLWHWPLIVFFTYYNIDEPTLPQSAVLIVLSFVLGALSWRFIEQPFRHGSKRKSPQERRMFATALAAIAGTFAVGSTIYFARGFPERFPDEVRVLSAFAGSQNMLADECSSTHLQLMPRSPCTIGNPDAASLFLWGDSHAGALYGALQEIARTGPGTVYAATPRCPPLIGFGTDPNCIAGNQKRLDHVLSHPEITTVIIAARWSLYSRGRATKIGPAETNSDLPVLQNVSGNEYPQFTPEALEAFRRGLYDLVGKLLDAGKEVVIIYPVPEMGYDIPSTMARLAAEGRRPEAFAVSEKRFLRRQRFSIPLLDGLGEHPKLTRVYPDRTLCPSDQCLGYIDGTPLYFDSHHLSIPGSKRLEPALEAALNEGA
ncbi:acyltransferase family protein [Novosphingobium sp. M1R2S20]|uniref:Acyltransferase family protein n=1 Tax=Novosphingobium rhizovicinum TaxID=3228928 RepID=A0ABV3RG41_9SPHN